MKDLFSILVRAAFTFVAFAVIQFQVPYYFIILGGLGAGFFLLKTGDDRALALGILVGTVLFGVWAVINEIYHPFVPG